MWGLITPHDIRTQTTERESMNLRGKIFVKETYVNVDEYKHFTYGDSDTYETDYNSVSEFLQACIEIHGDNYSPMYLEDKEGNTNQVGWVFEKIDTYEDTGEEFKAEVWVSLFTKKPVTTVEEFPLSIGDLNNPYGEDIK